MVRSHVKQTVSVVVVSRMPSATSDPAVAEPSRRKIRGKLVRRRLPQNPKNHLRREYGLVKSMIAINNLLARPTSSDTKERPKATLSLVCAYIFNGCILLPYLRHTVREVHVHNVTLHLPECVLSMPSATNANTYLFVD